MAAGLLVSAYHLAEINDSSSNGAIAEARYFLGCAGNYIGNGYLPPALDLEAPYVNSAGTNLSQWARVWLQYIQQQKPGTIPIIYTPYSILESLDSDLQTNYPLWIATDDNDPTGTPSYDGTSWPTWKFKQYLWGEDGGSCSGITGSVDLDSFNGDLNALNALANVTPAADFTYTINNGTITITGYTGSGGAVTIPSTINGLPVTSIGGWAFHGCTSLTSVTIPNSVTSIGRLAFAGCTSLTSVTIPNSVISIAVCAFHGCTSLTNVTISNSVTSIGDGAFASCTSLTSITIPDSVTYIGESAFEYCSSLTSVTIPTSVTYIGRCYAFAWCTSLTNVTIPASVTHIGDYTFSGCPNLSAIIVDANNLVYSSVAGVLFDKNQTTLIQCPGAKPGNYTIPNSVTSLVGERVR